VWIDKGGVAYKSAQGREAGSNFTGDVTLVNIDWYRTVTPEQGAQIERRESLLQPPALCDRDAGDQIVVLAALSTFCDWIQVEFGYQAAG
jgi:hypothetical protein